MLTCKGCGASYDDNASHCPYCGKVNPGFVLNSKGELQLPVAHSVQTQCRNCGGFKVGQESVNVAQNTGTEETYIISSLWSSGWIVFLFPLYILLLPIDLFRWLSRLKVKKVVMYKYECQLCGYKWTWRVDQPKPQTRVEIKPDLIAAGEEKLRKAAEQQKALEAHEWMRRYGNK